jgi:hypothetical protein
MSVEGHSQDVTLMSVYVVFVKLHMCIAEHGAQVQYLIISCVVQP